ncbi:MULTISPECIES: hypothetical protein [Nocardia]|uniref:hypothetical protein n=1 Tax=Nocardia TaxID=1817 RepID=UPI000D6959A3|nr:MULTISPECIES: hypothetical protein [Nocardia]
MSFKWICETYNVPAEKNGRVRFTGRGYPQLGTIVSAPDASLRVLFDGQSRPVHVHPTYRLEYLVKDKTR